MAIIGWGQDQLYPPAEKTKAFWSTPHQCKLKQLADSCDLDRPGSDVRPPSSGLKILGVPLESTAFVNAFLLDKFEAIDEFIRLAVNIQDGRMAHNIHRATASACRMTHFLRLIPSAEVATLWLDFDNRQPGWFERMCDVPSSDAARTQAHLPTGTRWTRPECGGRHCPARVRRQRD